MMFALADRCPRLALARDQHNQLVRDLWRREREHSTRVLNMERLVAHRELQLQRAYRTRDLRYIAKRQDKLAAARHALKCLKAERIVLGDDIEALAA